MITQTTNPDHLNQEARQIRTRVPAILSKWGLPPKFNRWRLTQDPETGLAVLFAVLNSQYIAAHTSIPFSDYFAPRLLDDLTNDLHVQVVSCYTDGLRYAFILDHGSLGKLPTHIEFSIPKEDRLVVGVIYKDEPASAGWINLPGAPSQRPVEVTAVDDHALVHQGVGAFLKVFDDIKQRDDAAIKLSQQAQDIVIIDEDEFKKRVMEYEADQQRIKHVRTLLDDSEHR
ncbi:MAG: hypothetical protein HY867_00445 [Chloroflexi bacterium]|nr:hypothetical protein [Chloroflexota bacterium]